MNTNTRWPAPANDETISLRGKLPVCLKLPEREREREIRWRAASRRQQDQMRLIGTPDDDWLLQHTEKSLKITLSTPRSVPFAWIGGGSSLGGSTKEECNIPAR